MARQRLIGWALRHHASQEVTLVRQLTESRQRLHDLRAVREEEVRQLHSLLARQVRPK